MAKKGYGTTLSGATAGTIGKVIDFDTAMMAEVDVIDSTNMASTAEWKEKMAGLKDPGRLSFTLEYDGGASGISDKIDDALGVSQVWTVTFPDSATWVCSGFVQAMSVASPAKEKIIQTVTIEFSGQPTFTKSA